MHPRAMATSGTAKPFPPFPGITAGGRPSWNQFHRPELGFVRGSGIPPSRPRCMTISLAPPTKAGPFSRGQLLVNERGVQVVEVTLLTAMTWAAEPVFHPQLLLLH